MFLPLAIMAQGQDSETWDRDLLVISTMLPGSYDNSNQSYFDVRGDDAVKHRRIHVDVRKVEAPAQGEHVFIAEGYWDSDEEKGAGDYLWVLSADDESGAVRMLSWAIDADQHRDSMPERGEYDDGEYCELFWRREATQFRARAGTNCSDGMPDEFVLSEPQLWMATTSTEGADFEMHRTRTFQCHADMPGVSGGGDTDYRRYEGFFIHDRGDSFSFTSDDGRDISISLFLVDWPINNYVGEFARDSLVIYINETTGGESMRHGYAFTRPQADRIGINLRWILAMCYMTSNKEDTPFM